MQEKSVNPMTVFYYSQTTTLRKISEVADQEIPKMMEEASKLQLEEVAPMVFRYIGCTEDLDKEFKLEIAMVVKEAKESNGKYGFKKFEPFKCMSHIYKGDINKIGEEYKKIMPPLFQSGKQPSNEIREVYTKYIDMTSAENITEIQIGLN